MFGAILKATNSSFQKGVIFCRSIYVKKVMKLLAFIFEQPSYLMEVLGILLTYQQARSLSLIFEIFEAPPKINKLIWSDQFTIATQWGAINRSIHRSDLISTQSVSMANLINLLIYL